jgi:hypothetical protein
MSQILIASEIGMKNKIKTNIKNNHSIDGNSIENKNNNFIQVFQFRHLFYRQKKLIQKNFLTTFSLPLKLKKQLINN